VLTFLLPHWGPNAPAAPRLNSVGWLLRSLAVWLTLQLGGYHNPLAGSLALVGWPLHSLAGCRTLQISGYRCPIVGIPFTAVLSHSLPLLHLCPDGPRILSRIIACTQSGQSAPVRVCWAKWSSVVRIMLGSWRIRGGFGFWLTSYRVSLGLP